MEQDKRSNFNIEFEYYTTGSENIHKTIFRNLKNIFSDENGLNLDFENGSFICFGNGWCHKYTIINYELPPIQMIKFEKPMKEEIIEDFNIEDYIDFEYLDKKLINEIYE